MILAFPLSGNYWTNWKNAYTFWLRCAGFK